MSPQDDQHMLLMQTRAYYKGVREGIWLYAHWKDGVQYVGNCGLTLDTALARANEEEQNTLNRYAKRELELK